MLNHSFFKLNKSKIQNEIIFNIIKQVIKGLNDSLWSMGADAGASLVRGFAKQSSGNEKLTLKLFDN